jgi:cytochrome c biogenesis protein CcmG, thiol:disulfide interchange protein DsbE
MRRWLLLVPVVVLFVVGGIGLFRVRPPAEVGKPPASFSLPLIEGRRPSDTKLTLDDLVGKTPIVLNFWASWCEPCKDEAPAFRRAAERFEGDVTFLGVAILDGPGPAGDFLKEYRIPYRSVVDTRGVTAKRFGVTGVPETVFIDARGIVAGAYSGALEGAELERLVDDLLELEAGETLRITGSGETRPVP